MPPPVPTPLIIGEATSSSELLADRTASEYNFSEDIFSEIESEISIKRKRNRG